MLSACRLLLCVLVAAFALIGGAHGWAYECGTAATPCNPPNCVCASFKAPPSVPANDIPQFVKLSMDDWIITENTQQLIYGAAGADYADARGCSPRLTAYTSTMYSDYRFVQQLYQDGHEIATHTVSHSTSYTSTLEKWRYEISGAKTYLKNYSYVPWDDMKGMRAPYLSFSPLTFTAMAENNVVIDSSMACDPKIQSADCPYGSFFWPFTLDYDSGIPCGLSSSSVCPGRQPGVWEVPMTFLFDATNQPAIANEVPPRSLFMDPVAPSTYPGGLLQLLKDNFHKRYDADRAPFSIHYHATYFREDPSRVQTILDFFKYVAALPDVFFVTDAQLVQWMKNPVPASVLANSGTTYLSSCAATSSSTTCKSGLPNTCFYQEQNFETCASCPEYWPGVCLDGQCMDNEECTCPEDCPGKTCSSAQSWSGAVVQPSPAFGCFNMLVTNTGASMARNWKIAVETSSSAGTLSGWGWESVTRVSGNRWILQPQRERWRVPAGSTVPPVAGQMGLCWSAAGNGVTFAQAFPTPFSVTMFQHDCVNTPCPGVCLDGICGADETCQSCPQDCPVCCGDGKCNAGETCSSCPQDCGACTCGSSPPGTRCAAGSFGLNSGRCIAGGTCQYLCDTVAACPTQTCKTGSCTVVNGTSGTVACVYSDQSGTPCPGGACSNGVCVPQTQATQYIASLTLVQQGTNADIAVLKDGDIVNVAAYGNINIRANIIPSAPALSQVKFFVDNVAALAEAKAPYAIGGDANGVYNAWAVPMGKHIISASSCTVQACTTAYSISVTFVSSPQQSCSACGAILGPTCAAPSCTGVTLGVPQCVCDTTPVTCSPSCDTLTPSSPCRTYSCVKVNGVSSCVESNKPAGTACGTTATSVCTATGFCVDVCSPNPCSASPPCGTSTCSVASTGTAQCTPGFLSGVTGGCDPNTQMCTGGPTCTTKPFCQQTGNEGKSCGSIVGGTSVCKNGQCTDVCAGFCLASNQGCATVSCSVIGGSPTCLTTLVPAGQPGTCNAATQFCSGTDPNCQTKPANGCTSAGAPCDSGLGPNSGRCAADLSCTALCLLNPCAAQACKTGTCSVVDAAAGTTACSYTNLADGTGCTLASGAPGATCTAGVCSVKVTTAPPATTLAPVAPRVTGFYLTGCGTKAASKDLVLLANGATVDRTVWGTDQLQVRAAVDPVPASGVGSVGLKATVNGNVVIAERGETVQPYMLNGDTPATGVYNAYTMVPGTWVVTARYFTGTGMTGTPQSPASSVTFTVV